MFVPCASGKLSLQLFVVSLEKGDKGVGLFHVPAVKTQFIYHPTADNGVSSSVQGIRENRPCVLFPKNQQPVNKPYISAAFYHGVK